MAGHPVRRGLSIQSAAVYGILDRPPSAGRHGLLASSNDDDIVRILAARKAPESLKTSFALERQRAQGRPGARCTRGLVCNCAQRTRTRAYRFSGNIRPSLRNGFTAYFVLSPVNGSFATVVPAETCFSANLTPAPRRQDHTTSPYASQPHSSVMASASTATCPNVRDDGRRPSGVRQDGDSYSFDLPDGLSGIFLREGLDRLLD